MPSHDAITVIQKTNPWCFPVILLLSVLAGGFTGYALGDRSVYLKPVGEIFLNLLLSAIVPLVFFSVSSAIASTRSAGKLGRILLNGAAVFLLTGMVAALFALVVVRVFPLLSSFELPSGIPPSVSHPNISTQLVSAVTAPDFVSLFSHQHILALIIFAILVGLAAIQHDGEPDDFARFLRSGERVFTRVFSLIMYLAPLGFFAWFAVLVAESGPKLMGAWLRVGVTYYLATTFYFVSMYSVWAWLAAGTSGLRLFWTHVFLPMITALATCSSAASIPANLKAARAMGVSPEIYETIIPLGTMLHKEGSIIGGVFKIAFVFALFHLDFSGVAMMATAVLIALLVGTVMGAIPGGGMLGELLILTVYGFPPSVLIAMATISLIIDPLATMLNVTGNTISALLVQRFTSR